MQFFYSGHIIPTIRAVKILHTKEIKGDEIVEIKIWQVPKSKNNPHGVKYSIVYVKRRERLVGYDNAEGKGNHRHYRDKEEPYAFNSMQDLLRDFRRDLREVRGGDWDED